jgi:hypothetical protein
MTWKRKESIVAALSDERVRVLELALEFAAYTYAVRSLLTADRRHGTNDFDSVQEQLIQGIIAHLDLVPRMEKKTKRIHRERTVEAGSVPLVPPSKERLCLRM